MKISAVDVLHADGGWRPFSFLKLTTNEGLTGWSEFSEGPWNRGLTAVVRSLTNNVLGVDPRAFSRVSASLHAQTRMAPAGINAQAIAAIENACLDISAKALGVPVYALFGGPIREKISVYWSHCGSFRVRHGEFFEKVIGTPPLRTLADLTDLGKEARSRGFKAVKTNPVIFEPGGPRMLNPGFSPIGLDLSHTADSRVINAITTQMDALRTGLGSDMGLMLDLNFGYRPEALRRIATAVEPYQLTWLEMDVHDSAALATVRSESKVPIASCETLYGRRGYKPYLEAYAADIAVIDIQWNGFAESVRIAAMAETYEVNTAPHNFTGPLCDLMSAHFCAAVPNVHVMEIEVDDVPWKGELLKGAARVEQGQFMIPTAPGWGAEVNEEAVAAHPLPANMQLD
jgi:L-alanine-DL-glutamate epimerase-like enolase superfamily enzyme